MSVDLAVRSPLPTCRTSTEYRLFKNRQTEVGAISRRPDGPGAGEEGGGCLAWMVGGTYVRAPDYTSAWNTGFRGNFAFGGHPCYGACSAPFSSAYDPWKAFRGVFLGLDNHRWVDSHDGLPLLERRAAGVERGREGGILSKWQSI